MDEENSKVMLSHYLATIHDCNYVTARNLLKQATDSLFHAGNAPLLLDLAHHLPPTEQDDPALQLCLGDAWRLCNDWTRANTAYHAAEQLACTLHQREIHGQALARQALVCWLRGDVDGSVSRYQMAMSVFDQIDAEDLRHEAEQGYALALSYQGNVIEAMQILQKQIRLAQRTHDLNAQWMGLNNLAMLVYLRQGAYDLAMATIQEAQSIINHAAHRYGMAYLANSCAYIALHAAIPEHAQNAVETALHLAQSLNVPNISAFALINQAHLFALNQQFERGLQCCSQARTLLNSPSSSTLYSDLCLIEGLCHDNDVCLAMLEQAVSHARHTGDRWMIAQCLLVYLQHTTDVESAQIMLNEVNDLMQLYQPNWQAPLIHVCKSVQLNLVSFGRFTVTIDGKPIPDSQWKTHHSQILLMYLTLHQCSSRDQLIDLLWDDQPLEKVHARLRTTIKLLRQTLNSVRAGIEWICYQLHHYRLSPHITITSDVAQFHTLIAQAKARTDEEECAMICRQIQQYSVEQWMVGSYNEWIVRYREQLVRDWIWASEICLQWAVKNHDDHLIGQIAQAILVVDEWNEVAQHCSPNNK